MKDGAKLEEKPKEMLSKIRASKVEAAIAFLLIVTCGATIGSITTLVGPTSWVFGAVTGAVATVPAGLLTFAVFYLSARVVQRMAA